MKLPLLSTVLILPLLTVANPIFTSRYTDATIPTPTEEIEIPHEDPTYYYAGISGYQIFEYSSAMTDHRNIKQVPESEWSISLTPDVEDQFEGEFGTKFTFGSKIEWRYINGVPFAVIYRVGAIPINEGRNSSYSYGESHEWLLICGLKGYESIDTQVPAWQPNANERARFLADSLCLFAQHKMK